MPTKEDLLKKREELLAQKSGKTNFLEVQKTDLKVLEIERARMPMAPETQAEKPTEASWTIPDTAPISDFDGVETWEDLKAHLDQKGTWKDSSRTLWESFILKIELEKFMNGRIDAERLPDIPGLKEKAIEIKAKLKEREEKRRVIHPTNFDRTEQTEKEIAFDTERNEMIGQLDAARDAYEIEYKKLLAQKTGLEKTVLIGGVLGKVRNFFYGKKIGETETLTTFTTPGKLPSFIERTYEEIWNGNLDKRWKNFSRIAPTEAFKQAKEVYEKKVQEAIDLIQSKTKELEMERGKSEEEAAHLARARVYAEIISKEQVALAEMEIEKQPPAKRGTLRKAWDAYLKMPKTQRIILTAGLFTVGSFAVASSGVIAGASVVGGITGVGLDFLRRIIVSSVSGGAVAGTLAVTDKIWKDRSLETKEAALNRLQEEFVAGTIDPKTYREQHEQVLLAEKKTRRNHIIGKSLIAFGVGAVVGFGSTTALSHGGWTSNTQIFGGDKVHKGGASQSEAEHTKPITETQKPAVAPEEPTYKPTPEKPIEAAEPKASQPAPVEDTSAEIKGNAKSEEIQKIKEAEAELFQPKNADIPREAIIQKGEGIEHAFARQIEHDPELQKYFKWDGKSDLHKFAGKAAHRASLQLGYVNAEGQQIWIKEPGAANVLKLEAGKLLSTEYNASGTLIESHTEGDAFEGANADKHEIEHGPQTAPKEAVTAPSNDPAVFEVDTTDADTDPLPQTQSPATISTAPEPVNATETTAPQETPPIETTIGDTTTQKAAAAAEKYKTLSVYELPPEDLLEIPTLDLAKMKSEEFLNSAFKEYNGLQIKVGTQTTAWANIKDLNAGKFLASWNDGGISKEYDGFGQELRNLGDKYGYGPEDMENISIKDAWIKLQFLDAEEMKAAAKAQ